MDRFGGSVVIVEVGVAEEDELSEVEVPEPSDDGLDELEDDESPELEEDEDEVVAVTSVEAGIEMTTPEDGVAAMVVPFTTTSVESKDTVLEASVYSEPPAVMVLVLSITYSEILEG